MSLGAPTSASSAPDLSVPLEGGGVGCEKELVEYGAVPNSLVELVASTWLVDGTDAVRVAWFGSSSRYVTVKNG